METIIEKSLHQKESGNSKLPAIIREILRTLYPESEDLLLFPIAGDGSDRRFFRVKLKTKTFVLMYAPSDNPLRLRENLAFSYLSAYLASHRIPVPEIYFSNPSKGIFLMEDLGDLSLHTYTLKNPQSRQIAYRKAVELLVKFQIRATNGVEARFFIDGESYNPSFVLEKELEYFRRSFLCDFLGLPVSWGDLKDDFFRLSELAGTHETTSCIHRDFQSRNIMIKDGKLRLIDYQGMRYGPGEYDLAALVIDPYVDLPLRERRTLIRLYARLGKGFSPSRYEAVSLCRNLQIIAAFSFLGKQRGKTFFLGFLPRAWKELKGRRSTLWCLRLSRLSHWLDLAEDKIRSWSPT
ncbi:MAG: phosphotransferase [Syntrophobacterales bacterium]|nr:phosphotransferase [Syntrophobacterales bacterium]